MHPSLQAEIEHLRDASGVANLGLAFHDLATGSHLFLEPDLPFHPASLFKICVMMEVFHQACAGSLSLDDPLQVRNEFESIADGSLYSLSPDDDSEADLYAHASEELPIRDLINRMITRSSNLATSLLMQKVGADHITRFMGTLGAPELTVLRGPEDGKAFALGLNNSGTARGYLRILVRLASHQVLSPAASDEMIAVLRGQEFNEGIPAKLPEGVLVAHKTGWIDKHYHDAAIVYPPARDPYVLVVLTRGLAEKDAAPALVADISSMIYRSEISC